MIRKTAAVALSLLLGLSAGQAAAQSRRLPIITEAHAEQHGLERAWLTQVRMDFTRDRVQAVVLYTPMEDAAEADMGAAEAPAEGPALGIPTAELSRSVLYVQTRTGKLHALDAETGRTLWAAQIGDRDHPSEAPAVNDHYVAVVNAGTLYIVDRLTGHVKWRKALDSVPITAAALSDEWVYVTSLSGDFYAYDLEDPDKMWKYGSLGTVRVPPIVTREVVAWATSRGSLYMSAQDAANVEMRFDTERAVTAPLTYLPPFIYIASQDGYIYAVNEKNGQSPWRFGVSEAIRQPPVAIDGFVYVAGQSGGMYCLPAVDGPPAAWYAPRVFRFLASSGERLYTTDEFGRMLVLDAKTGGRLGEMRIDRLDLQMTNHKTDRIYLGTKSGLLMCFHEIGRDEPLVHRPPAVDQGGIVIQQPGADEAP